MPADLLLRNAFPPTSTSDEISLFCSARWLRSAISRRMRADFAETGAGGGVGAAFRFEAASARLIDFGFDALDELAAFATGFATTTLLFASTGAGERLLTGADGLAVNAFTERLETARVAEVADFFSPDFVTSLRAELLGETEEAAGLLAFAFAVDCLGPVTGLVATCFAAVRFGIPGFAAVCLTAVAALTTALGRGDALLLAVAFGDFLASAAGFDFETADFATAGFNAVLASLRTTVAFLDFDFCFCRAATNSSLVIPRTSPSPADEAMSASSCRERALKSEGVFNAKLPLF